jgi:hypothetical protein
VFVDHVAVAEVGDTRAAEVPQLRERRAVAVGVEEHVNPVPSALERRAVVRRAERDEGAELRSPRRLLRFRVEAGAAGHEAAHAVAEEDDFTHGSRPVRHGLFEE